jgi:hypothetical protein
MHPAVEFPVKAFVAIVRNRQVQPILIVLHDEFERYRRSGREPVLPAAASHDRIQARGETA